MDGPVDLSAPPAYDLDQLGWLQFERLCTLVLADAGLTRLAWTGRAEAVRAATAEGPIVACGRTIRPAGTVTLAVIWVSDGLDPARRQLDFTRRLGRLVEDRELGDADGVLALTNLDAGPAVRAFQAAFRPTSPPRLDVLGIQEIGRSLDLSPGLRAALPSVLGLRDLARLIDQQTRERSAFDVAAAQALARVFSPTRAFDHARAVLGRHRFVVLTGPPEMGKTAIARMVALGQMTAGWQAHETNTPDQVWSAFDPDRRQVFVADDAFGSTEYRPDAADRWAHELARLLELLDDNHWLIWTSRPAPLKAGLRRVQRERGSEHFPAPAEVLVDASDLDLAEKTLILFRHAKNLHAGLAVRRLIRSTGPLIVEHPHFTPERIRRLITDRHPDLLALALAADGDQAPTPVPSAAPWRQLVERELTTPTQAMATSFAALGADHRHVLIAMLDVPAGFVDERQLAATLRRHHPGGLTARPADLVDRLTDHFLRVTPLGIGWVHPSWRDLVIDQLRTDPAARRRFLAAGGLDAAMLALSQAGGPTGDRTFPLLLDDTDWDTFADRTRDLVRELDDHDATRLLLAIADALSDRVRPAQRAEVTSLAGYVLGATRRAWDADARVLPVALLDAWYALNARLANAAPPPELRTTWSGLRPIVAGPVGRAELARADDWLTLAQLLDRRDPAALAELGFPLREGPVLERMIAAAGAAGGSTDDGLTALAESIITRIRGLATLHAPAARSARAKLALDAAHRHAWWTPADLDTPPTDQAATGPDDRFDTADIARVLRDL
jgi:hypothetical protein